MPDRPAHMVEDLESLLDHAPDLVARLGPDLRFLYVNAQAERVAGVPACEWVGRTPDALGFDDHQVGVALREALETGAPRELRTRLRRDGDERCYELRIVPERRRQGPVTGLVWVARDVTDRIETLRRLSRTTRRLHETLESLSEAVFLIETGTRRILDCNRAAERMFGRSRTELLGGTTSLLHRDDEAFRRFHEESREALAAGRAYRGRFTMRRADGSAFPTENTVVLLDHGATVDEAPGEVVSVVRDRTEEVEAARTLERYNRRLTSLRDMDRAILASRTEDEVVREAAEHALDVVGAQRASVTLVEHGSEGARLAAVVSRLPRGPSAGQRIRVCPFPIDALRLGDTQRVPDLLALPGPLPEALQALADAGVRSLLSIPLGVGDTVLGALNLSFTEPGAFDDQVEAMAREVADHLALGLRQIRLEASVREEALERSRAELRAAGVQVRLEELLDELNVGVLRTDLHGIILDRNDAARRIMALQPEQSLVGRPVGEILWPGDSWDQVLDQIRSGEREHGILEVKIRRADGTPAWVSVMARTVREEETGAMMVEGVFQDVTEEMRLRQEIVGISTAERRRIGQDLHDDLGQHLTGLAFSARELSGRLEGQGLEEEGRAARDLEALVNAAIRKTRHLARGVQPPALQHRGLHDALDELARDIREHFGLETRLRVDDPPPEASVTEAANLFRVAQEAITNAARHGGASRVEVSWAREEGGRALTVADDGTGFEPSGRARGVGLRIMRYRARLLGGRLEVRSGDGGTTVRVVLPASTEAGPWSDRARAAS